ncbi:MAG: tRNA lysidine(34) synthetase TilS [Sulfurimonas sp.]|jgi:tRNA(Ile)-lysidine synthase
MLEKFSLHLLEGKKNLLAFSGGGDSTALFFILLNHNIPFDIAIVDYGIREQSKEEVTYAKELAKLHNSTCHVFHAPSIEKNFESRAREIRYNFFEELITAHKYENLITAHHLGDRFEWMLMQFCKGAGCAEIAGMQKIQKRKNYTLLRPLLHLDKKELLVYLHANNLHYYEDESNTNEDIKRNEFRHNYSLPMIEKYLGGIKKSFEYLDKDRECLVEEKEIKMIGNFAYFESSHNKRADIYAIDKYLKSQFHMPSTAERELLETENCVVLGRKFLVVQERGFVFIVPYIVNDFHMPKEFKEEMRKLKIEPKLRPYLYKNSDAFLKIKELVVRS